MHYSNGTLQAVAEFCMDYAQTYGMVSVTVQMPGIMHLGLEGEMEVVRPGRTDHQLRQRRRA